MGKIKHFFNYLKYFTLSIYGFVVIFLAFAVWVLFFDINSIKGQRQIEKENLELKKDTAECNRMIAELQSKIRAFDSLEYIEKFAREHYKMKVEDEEVFLFEK